MHGQSFSSLRIVLAFAAVLGSLICCGAAISVPPNILLILADDVGREVLECYGGSSYRTPRLDRLAREGMRFTHAYVMPTCHPTRTTLLTGQYPFRLGHPDWGTFPREAENRTFAQQLKQAGYTTAIAGKWQLTLLGENPRHPHELGFDEYCLFGWHEGPRYHQPHIWQNGRLRDDVRDRYGPDVYVEFLKDFMRRNRNGPFLAFYSMALCHAVTNDLEEPVSYGPRGMYDTYSEMVAAMDERVGEMVDEVDALGLNDNSLILYVTDNGTPAQTIIGFQDGQYIHENNVSQFGDRLVPGGKTTLTDWGTRVPMVARWPGNVPANSVNDALVDASDFLPTFVELAGAKMPQGVTLNGQSFAHELLERPGTEREWVFAEHNGDWFVKDRRWKLYNDGRFFDTDNDPDESHSLDLSQLSGAAGAAYGNLQARSAEIAAEAE